MKQFIAHEAIENATTLFNSRYHGAEFCVASGSIIQGVGTKYSDLDLIVVFSTIEAAYRESFLLDDMPVEAFVHDYETLQSFMDEDLAEGCASMQHMLATGKIIPCETLSAINLQRYARNVISSGLMKSDPEKIEALRYAASDLIDDLRGDRPINEQRAILYSIYHTLGELRLRASGEFLSSGKRLARKLKDCDPEFTDKIEAVMAASHVGHISSIEIDMLLSLLQSLGGYLFDGNKRFAPITKRKKAEWMN
jgi:hypothetical protein